MTDVFIADGVRTAISSFDRGTSPRHAVRIVEKVVRTAVELTGVDPREVSALVLASSGHSEAETRSVARTAAQRAGLPEEVGRSAVTTAATTGMDAITTAQSLIASGADVVVAAGVELSARAPEVPAAARLWRWPLSREGDPPTESGTRWRAGLQLAESLARQRGFTREVLDEHAWRSHRSAKAAFELERLAGEIVAFGEIERDAGLLVSTTRRDLESLRPICGPGGVITTGNASSLDNGAAAVVLMSGRHVSQWERRPRARIVATADVSVRAGSAEIGQVAAVREVLRRSEWTVDGLDSVELDEISAAHSLACIDDLGLFTDTVNVDGGAIALGTPFACMGPRLAVTLMRRLEHSHGRRGLMTTAGADRASAMLLERVVPRHWRS